jgi:hypothetical protein
MYPLLHELTPQEDRQFDHCQFVYVGTYYVVDIYTYKAIILFCDVIVLVLIT